MSIPSPLVSNSDSRIEKCYDFGKTITSVCIAEIDFLILKLFFYITVKIALVTRNFIC